MMGAEVEVRCNAGSGEVTRARVNSVAGTGRGSGTPGPGRSSWRSRSCGPDHTPRRSWSTALRQAGAGLGATSYLVGVSTRKVEKLAAALGVAGLSKSQFSAMAAELDELADSFRNRPLDARPVHLHVDRRPHPESPGERATIKRALPDRDRGERGGAPGDPRHRRRSVPRRCGHARPRTTWAIGGRSPLPLLECPRRDPALRQGA